MKQQGAGSRTSPCVLVVEDNDDIRQIVELVMRSAGMEVITASNGREAIDALTRSPVAPCVIFSDVMMPVMDGLEFCRWKAAREEYRQIPVVLLTAYSAAAESLRDVPIAACLAKPVDVDTLVTVARSYWPHGTH